MDTLKYDGKKNSMLLFPTVGSKEGIVVKLLSKTSLKEQLIKYCEDNGFKDVEFTYENTWIKTKVMVTIWCHHHLYEGLTNVYLVAVIDSHNWSYYSDFQDVLTNRLNLDK